MLAFLHAARTGSFSRAALELNLTHSAISQQIRTLEEFLGQPLFVRGGRGSRLTDAGQIMARILPDGLTQIDQALSMAKNRNVPPKRLIIDVDSELAQSWLNPRLPTLLAALPGYEVLFQSVPRPEHPALTSADVSLRYGYGDWKDDEFVLICDDRVVAVAAPELLARHQLQTPVTPDDVQTLPQLGYTRRSWIPWRATAGLTPVEPDAVAVFDNVANLVAAAEAGIGVGLARSLLVHDALRDGRLVALSDATVQARYNLYAVWPRGRGERVAMVVETVRRLATESL